MTAAQQLIALDHNGFIIGGEFERGHHRGGGEYAVSIERDRVRALQLFEQALPHLEGASNSERAGFYRSWSNAVLFQRTHQQSWRLQDLTDISQLPDVQKGYYAHHSSTRGAPVDAEGPFRLLLRLNPGFVLPAQTTPKIVAVFRKVEAEERAIFEQKHG